ncbi:Zn-ribbon domain-containing OB-fold protein [Rhodococcus sp. ARC_M6]|uniref:Zn-ribbon domain-containing OB-fold protein n=1 Tax=Rhodococcus sp. ARC_M6 TaxID=2928852 RepID=UPI001FB1FF13|nr:OB-fold nucleic acid binding domain-containing protein [Rhodococcus sp. ARC_M6]MCJ0902898.1 OB-fold domain-containing protein [Rhodococcus sp. ARC_M6]
MGKSGVAEKPLSAPLKLEFNYTRSTGPTIGAFVSALRNRKVIGALGSDGRVFVPPQEFDPITAEPLTEFVGVSDGGTVVSWTWNAEPYDGQPLAKPFAWALIKLDGADSTMLHAVDVDSSDAISTGMRVRARWAAERVGQIQDIECFEPGETENGVATLDSEGDPVTMITTPISLDFMHTASLGESFYLRGLAEGKLIGGRSGPNDKVYIPPRGTNPTNGRPMVEQVELPDRGIITTFCIVNVPFLGQKIKPPYVAAYVLLDGADIAFLHLILECDAADIRMGMRVEAKWKPREEWGYGLENIEYFRPTGEPDAEYDTYKHHL